MQSLKILGMVIGYGALQMTPYFRLQLLKFPFELKVFELLLHL